MTEIDPKAATEGRRPSDEPTERLRPMGTLEEGAELREVLGAMFGEDVARAAAERPCVGRYEIIRRIGSGGMGSVYEARDPNLDRRVAIKLLHEDTLSEERLIAEGQAMAKLSHPNVVTVYDVDRAGERVFVAMELVEGQTLRRWLQRKARSWREVLELYVPLGQGIAAAHAQGLVHCDLKPENVLLGDDDRPRITDFGIARLRGRLEPLPATTTSDERPRTWAPIPLAGSGPATGTPHYMSPEQYVGQLLDDRADQFSFCVMLWEALLGARPFQGGSLLELGANITAGDLQQPARGHGVPTWLLRACTRGLAVKPEDRWHTMSSLLEALEGGRARARNRMLATAAIAVSLVAVAGWATHSFLDARRRSVCAEAGAEIDAAWDAGPREDVERAIVGTQRSYAPATAQRVLSVVDGAAAAWRSNRIEACEAHDVSGDWDSGVYERATWCLKLEHAEFRQTVDTLAQTNDKTVAGALDLAASLRPETMRLCATPRALESIAVPTVQLRSEILAARAELFRTQVQEGAGSLQDALGDARRVLARAEVLEWWPLIADARIAVAQLTARAGGLDDARSLLMDAYFDSRDRGLNRESLDAALGMVYLEGELRHEAEHARLWGRHATLLLGASGLEEASEAANLHDLLGIAERNAGRHAQARSQFETARSLYVSLEGEAHPDVTRVVGHMGGLARAVGDNEEAIEISRTILDRMITEQGPLHPSTAERYMDLATALASAGRPSEALPPAEKALEIRTAAHGDATPSIAGDLITIGGIHNSMGNAAEAIRATTRALTILESTVGANHPRVGATLNNLGNAQRDQGQLREALSSFERALSIFESKETPAYTRAVILQNLGEIRADLKEHVAARDLFNQSLVLREEALGEHHPRVAVPLLGLSRVSLESTAVSRAQGLEAAERALELSSGDGGLPRYHSLSAQHTARLLWRRGEHQPARTVVQTAHDALAKAGPDGVRAAEALGKWLAEHALH